MKTMTPSNKNGFTLMEVVIVIAIIAILAAVAVPNFLGWLPRYRLNKAAQDVLSGMIQARSRAIKDYTWIVYGPNPTNTGFRGFMDSGDPGTDADGDGVPDGTNDGVQNGPEQTVVTVPLPSGVTITASFQATFNRRGLPNTAALAPWDITLRNSVGATRQIRLLPTGFAQII